MVFAWTAVVILAILTEAALGHDHWISRGEYRDPVTKEWCCGAFDCFEISEKDVRVTPNGVEIISTKETVPFS